MIRPRSFIPLLVAALFAGAAYLLYERQPDTPPSTPPPAPTPEREPEPEPDQEPPAEDDSPVEAPLSPLAASPDWSEFSAFQATITRSEFLRMMEDVYTVSDGWKKWFFVGTKDVLVETGVPGERFSLRFASGLDSNPNPRDWRTADELGPYPAGQPLDGLRIAIDPGHIGGEWAKIEERWFQVGDASPVKEGDMTLLVAKLLLPRLEALGADVSLVRDAPEPVTTRRPDSFPDGFEALFYRTAEIHARAALVNQRLRPDIVLCLHFNAEAWGDKNRPTLVKDNHFHLLLNGAYTDSEIGLADHRYHLLRKIVQQTHRVEAALGATVAEVFVENTGLPPFLYETNSQRAVNVGGNPYLWARNLLANRLYDCPVVFLEPYVMNSIDDHNRIQAGFYEGRREVNGKLQPSIFLEYADSVAEGLARYYRESRPKTS